MVPYRVVLSFSQIIEMPPEMCNVLLLMIYGVDNPAIMTETILMFDYVIYSKEYFSDC